MCVYVSTRVCVRSTSSICIAGEAAGRAVHPYPSSTPLLCRWRSKTYESNASRWSVKLQTFQTNRHSHSSQRNLTRQVSTCEVVDTACYSPPLLAVYAAAAFHASGAGAPGIIFRGCGMLPTQEKMAQKAASKDKPKSHKSTAAPGRVSTAVGGAASGARAPVDASTSSSSHFNFSGKQV